MCDCFNTMFKEQLPMQVQNSFEMYLNGPGVHKSDLDDLSRMTDYGYVHRRPKISNKKMDIGTAAHCLILEGREKFHNQYVMFEKYTGKGSVKKNECAVQEFKDQGLIIMTPDDVKRLEAIRDCAMGNYEFAKLIESDSTLKECSTYFLEGTTNTVIATRQDIYKPTNENCMSYIVDLKITADPSFSAFSKVCASKRYYVQCAMYTDAIVQLKKQLGERDDVYFSLFAVGDGQYSDPECAWYYFSYEDYAFGMETYLNDLERLKEINLANPISYPDMHREISMPKWVYYEDEI